MPKWEGTKFNQFKFCTNSNLGFYFDFKSNYGCLPRCLHRYSYIHWYRAHMANAYAFVSRFLFCVSLFELKSFILIRQRGSFWIRKQKMETTKVKLLQQIHWLIACDSNQLNRLSVFGIKFSNDLNFNWTKISNTRNSNRNPLDSIHVQNQSIRIDENPIFVWVRERAREIYIAAKLQIILKW